MGVRGWMLDYEKAAVDLVVVRLSAMPPNVKFSVGSHGTFSKDQLVAEVKRKTDVGRAMVEMQLNYLRQMPSLSKKLTE